jgi:Fur family ferric uptake transcriptional regulator
MAQRSATGRTGGRLVPRPELAEQLDPVLDQIRSRGGRITWPRIAILEAMVEGDHHVTVEGLQARLSRTAPDVHVATAYRTLAALEELGVIYPLQVDHGGPAVWHLAHARHEHLRCTGCGTVIEVDAHEFDALRRSIAKRYGFALDVRHVVNQGRCAACQQATDAHQRPGPA